MVTVLITSVLILGILAIAVYFWQKPANRVQHPSLPFPNKRGLFDEAPPLELPQPTAKDQIQRAEILRLASGGDKSALQKAAQIDSEAYDSVLNVLVSGADNAPQLLALVSYVTRHELPVNNNLAEAFMQSWQQNPDRVSTAKMLHIAALTNNAVTYRHSVELVLTLWRAGKISDLSANELQPLLTGEFWLLSAGTRSSGAGFLLKRTLSSARRELEAGNN